MKKIVVISLLFFPFFTAQAQVSLNTSASACITAPTPEMAKAEITRLKQEKEALEKQTTDSLTTAKIAEKQKLITIWTEEFIRAQERKAKDSIPLNDGRIAISFINDLPNLTVVVLDSPFKGIYRPGEARTELLKAKTVCTIHYQWLKNGTSSVGEKTIKALIRKNMTVPVIKASDIGASSIVPSIDK